MDEMDEMGERVARKMFANSSFYGERDPDEIVERRLRTGPIREPAWKAFEAAAHTAIEEHTAALAEAGLVIVNMAQANVGMAAERDAACKPPAMTQEMIEAGIRAYGSDDDRSTPEKVLDIWTAMQDATVRKETG